MSDLTPTPTPSPEPARPETNWPALLLAELRNLAPKRHWGPALMAVGTVHLVFFLVAQALYWAEVYAAWASLSLWTVELATVVLTMRLVAGKGWLYEAPVVGLVFRVWVTFLILSFNAVMLNSLMGLDHLNDWFKIAWCSLASFGFATMAWLFGLRYLIPAFQMYFTSLLIFKFPTWGYTLHGVSWWLALQYAGWDIIQRRKRLVEPATPTGASESSASSRVP